MTSQSTRLFSVSVHLHHETPSAILVSDDGLRDHAVWLPKSLIEFEPSHHNIIEVTAPEWVLVDKKLV
jgi:hypothetical protein